MACASDVASGAAAGASGPASAIETGSPVMLQAVTSRSRSPTQSRTIGAPVVLQMVVRAVSMPWATSGIATMTSPTTARMNPVRSRWRSRSISRLGAAPDRMNTMQATTTIAQKLVRNRVIAPAASSGRPSSRQIPTVASGGTRETAIATPGSASLPVLRTPTNAPAAPAASATPRSSSPGEVRASSDGVSPSGSGMIHETR